MAKTKTTKVNVIQDEDKPIERNVLAQSIVNMSRSLLDLEKGGLLRSDIARLVHVRCRTGTSIVDVREVLKGLQQLLNEYKK